MNGLRRWLLLGLFVSVNVLSQEVWLFGIESDVFTQTHRLAQVYQVKHFLIDGGLAFDEQISYGLSGDESVAMAQMRERFERHKDSWSRLAKQAWQGAVNAQSIGVEKVPAITFDGGQTILYGLTDVVQAYHIYQQYLQQP